MLRHYSWKTFYVAVISIILVSAPDIALACSCVNRRYGPFHSGELLPANAKGVVYQNVSVYGDSDENGNNVVIRSLPPEPEREFFQIVDTTADREIKASIVKLDTTALDPAAAERRYFLYKRAESANCRFSRNEGRICRELGQIKRDNPQDWVTQLRENGELVEVTADVRARSGFFRIEPEGGFRAGHEYTFQTTQEVSDDTNESNRLPNGSITVRIDSRKVELSTLRDVTLELRKPPDLEMIPVPQGGSCSTTILADVQHVNYHVPAAIAPFQDSLAIVTTIAEQHRTGRNIFKPWHYRRSLCSSVKFGESQLGFARDLIFARCKPFHVRNPYKVRALYGMLEIHDSLLESNEERLTIATRTASECAPANLLTEIVARGNADELKQKLCLFGGGSSWDNFVGNPIDLFESILELTEHEDVLIRRCAVMSVIGLYLGESDFNHASITDRTIPALVKIAIDNRNGRITRTYITDVLEGLARRDANDVINRRRQRLIEQVPLLATALEDDEADVRNGVAEILTLLGRDAKAAVPALIAVLQNEEKPTYRAPTALVAIDPSHPQIIPTLITIVRDRRPFVAGTAIQALGQIGASDPRVPPVLIQVAKSRNWDAITALGELGAAGAAAIPLLLEIAGNAEYHFQRQYAIDSLIKIGTRERELFAVIVENMRNPIDTYSRQTAIESLGLLGPDAREWYPEVFAVLENNPTDRELSAAMSTLRAIAAPAEEIKSSLIFALEHQTHLDRGQILTYWVSLDSTDGKIIETLLREDSDRLLQMGCRAITPENSPQLSNKTAIIAALVAMIEDDTRNFSLTECAMSAAGNLLPIESQNQSEALCRAIRIRKAKENNTYRIREYEGFEGRVCSLV